MSYHQIFMVQGGMLEGDKEEGERSKYKTPKFLAVTRILCIMFRTTYK